MSIRLISLTVAALLRGACGATTDPAAEAPSLTLTPVAVTASVGVRTTATADVRGLGPAPTIEWVSGAPAAVVVESVTDGGRTAVLRFDRAQAATVMVTARGTHVLSATLAITLPAARATE